MSGDTAITLVGNLTADPELRFTQSGVPVADFTVAATPRAFDRATGEWKDARRPLTTMLPPAVTEAPDEATVAGIAIFANNTLIGEVTHE